MEDVMAPIIAMNAENRNAIRMPFTNSSTITVDDPPPLVNICDTISGDATIAMIAPMIARLSDWPIVLIVDMVPDATPL